MIGTERVGGEERPRRAGRAGAAAIFALWLLAGALSGAETGAVPSPDDPISPASRPARTTDPRLESLDWIIDSAVSKPPLRGADVAVLIGSLSSGETLYERSADRAMVPASNMKIVTGAAALHVLGPEFEFETIVATDEGPSGSVLEGNLYVRGSGDPSLVSEELWQLVEEIRALGVERIGGDLVLDAGYFDAAATASSAVSEGDRAYHARTGALSLNFNAIAVHVTPGPSPGDPALVVLSPATSFIGLRNSAGTCRRGSSSTLSVRRTFEDGKNIVSVEGRIPEGSKTAVFYRSLDDGLGYFGSVFRGFLDSAGIEIAGDAVPGEVPNDATVLVRHRSKPLSLIVRDLNKYSSNFVAEQLVKAIGAHTAGPPGTAAAGLSALGTYLSESGAEAGSYRLADGSGFSRDNRLSPRAIVRVMRRALLDFGSSYEYAASLSVSGIDGTLEDRMGYPGLRRAVRAKTGLLNGVTAISGLMETASGEEILFSIIVNGFACEAWHAHDLEHAILTAASRL